MKVFDAYARYYDLLYHNKDYAGEATFVDQTLRKFGVTGGELLELGCGTGKHAIELARHGWKVHGVDLSDAMVTQAQARADQLSPALAQRVQFQPGDVRTVRVGRPFDAAISLFHVMSYQTTDADLEAAIATAATHVKPGGLFLFDFWYGSAVLSDPPAVRIKRMQDDDLEVTRLAEPEMKSNENQVVVHYHVFLRNRHTQAVTEVREAHPMRFLFLPEMNHLLRRGGFEPLGSGAWCSPAPVGTGTWYGYLAARRVSVG